VTIGGGFANLHYFGKKDHTQVLKDQLRRIMKPWSGT
jgi:hypothetical protein